MSESFARRLRWAAWAVLTVFGLFLPALLQSFWLQLGALVFATSIAAIGLMLLFGRVGQLSLGHPFFLAIGAYGYILVASPGGGFANLWGLGLPSPVGLLAAVVIAGSAGLLISPISSRVRGLSLGLATLSLTFIGLWLYNTLESLTGGYNGRNAPALHIGPFSSIGSDVTVAGLTIGSAEFLWYVTLILLFLVSIFTANLLNGRIGRAFAAIRDAETHAAALGVEVTRYRVVAFTISSAYAGLAGALLAIIIQRVVPNYWSLDLALGYLAMIIIGGMRSISGAILGAAFVTMLPALLQRYGDAIPYVGSVGGSGLGPSVVSQVLYGVLIIVILIFEPQGLTRILTRIASFFLRLTKRHNRNDAGLEDVPSSNPYS